MGRLLAQLVGTLLLVGLALHFIWRLVAGAVAVGGVWLSDRRPHSMKPIPSHRHAHAVATAAHHHHSDEGFLRSK